VIGFSVCLITVSLKRGIDAQPKIDAAKEAGLLSPAQMRDLMRRAQMPGIVWGFQGLGLDEALNVWKVATLEERETLRPHLQRKMQTLGTMPAAERERLLPQAREVLGQ